MRWMIACVAVLLLLTASTRLFGQLIDQNKAPNTASEGISLALASGPYPTQIGAGRWGADSNASSNVIVFDPFRAIRRGRQLFQRGRIRWRPRQASNLDQGAPDAPDFPQFRHGSIRLTALFNRPTVVE